MKDIEGIPEEILQADEEYMNAINPGRAGGWDQLSGVSFPPFAPEVDRYWKKQEAAANKEALDRIVELSRDPLAPRMSTPEDRERIKNSDPAGVDTAFHFEAGKPRVDQLPPAALLEIAAVMGYGAEKYGEWNWAEHATKWKWGQLIGSMLRHIFYWMMREDIDPESGLNHMAHAGANIMMLLDLMSNGCGHDNRRPIYRED